MPLSNSVQSIEVESFESESSLETESSFESESSVGTFLSDLFERLLLIFQQDICSIKK